MEQKPFVPKKAVDFQKLKLERLMANPDKPVIMPEPRKEKGFNVPEFVRNVMGSSAGAGSGEFHVYRHLRRKEYTRQKYIDATAEQERLDEEFKRKLEENRRKIEEKTAKKRTKRLKKKEKMKQKKMKLADSNKDKPEKNKTSSEDSDDGDIELELSDTENPESSFHDEKSQSDVASKDSNLPSEQVPSKESES